MLMLFRLFRLFDYFVCYKGDLQLLRCVQTVVFIFVFSDCGLCNKAY